jgi:protocatechuate 3,4-dioxygenase beta subunit
MSERRGPLYLLTGLLLGILAGVLISRIILPVRYTDTEPSTLSTDQREAYRSLVARAYLAEADVNRARSRLALLQDAAMVEPLIAQAQAALAFPDQQANARAMALLAAALSKAGISITPMPGIVTPMAAMATTPVPLWTATSSASQAVTTTTQTATLSVPSDTPLPLASATPLPTQGSPYQLASKAEVCSPGAAPLMQIFVQDAQSQPVSGVKIEITLVNSAPAYFYTGLYPEINPGYADYLMTRGAVYSLRVGEGGQLVTGLQAPVCSAGGSSYTGGLKLVFKQQ